MSWCHPSIAKGRQEDTRKNPAYLAHYRAVVSKRYYEFAGQKGAYTRKRGLDRETNKALLLAHIRHQGQGTIQEFEQVLPGLTRYQIHSLLKELKREVRIRYVGNRRQGHYELM